MVGNCLIMFKKNLYKDKSIIHKKENIFSIKVGVLNIVYQTKLGERKILNWKKMFLVI